MGLSKLFIKTSRAPVVSYEMPNVSGGGHWCSARYRTQSIMVKMSQEDRQAKDILTRSGLKFEVVDLGEASGKEKLAVLFKGVRKTPTLWIEGSRGRKREGIKAISDYVSGQNSHLS